MTSYIKEYCGEWKYDTGIRLEIKLHDEETVLVTMYKPGEDTPMLLPWLDNMPALSMLGSLDNDGQTSLDIHLSDKSNGIFLNLSIDVDNPSGDSCTTSIIANEGQKVLNEYNEILGTVTKC